MTAWTLDWNDLSANEKEEIMKAVQYYACDCCGNTGQLALDAFDAVVDVIKSRDRKEIMATLEETQ